MLTLNSEQEVKRKFILVALYFLQGKDHKLSEMLDHGFDKILKVECTEGSKKSRHLLATIRLLFKYKCSVNYYNKRKDDYKSILNSEYLQKQNNDTQDKIRRTIDKYTDVYDKLEYSRKAKLLGDRERDIKHIIREVFSDRKSILRKINRHLDYHIKKQEIYCEEIEEGKPTFSRNKYTEIPKEAQIEYLLAIVIYLIRSYCIFIAGDSAGGRNIAWEKKALNDLSQAEYLCETLHVNLLERNPIKNDTRANEAIEKSITKYKNSEFYGNKGYLQHCLEAEEYKNITPWIYAIIDIFRGNIHYKVYDFSLALFFYKKATDRIKHIYNYPKILVDVLSDDYGTLENVACKIKMISCKTVVQTYMQKAKCYTELGFFLDSLKWYIKALCELVLMKLTQKGLEQEQADSSIQLFRELRRLVDYLDREKKESIFDKSHLRLFFEKEKGLEVYLEDLKKLEIGIGEKSGIHTHIIAEIKRSEKSKEYYEQRGAAITPERFKDIVSDDFKILATDILVRIGYILYLLQDKIVSLNSGHKETKEHLELWNKLLEGRTHEYVLPFFNIDCIWSNHISTFASYCKYTFFSGENKRFIGEDFYENIERLFAGYSLEKLVAHSATLKDDFCISERDKGSLESEAFSTGIINTHRYVCNNLGVRSMVNIDNIITIPNMIYSFLMRDGYIKRSNDFRKKKTGGNTDKFVVLRRWQSYNPKIPRPSHKNVLGGGYFLMWQGKGIVIDPGYDFIQNFYNEGFSLSDINAIVVTHSHPDHEDELSTILTLLYEWNERRLSSFQEHKYIDLFLNEGSFRKYNNWLYSPNTVVKKIIQLQTYKWDLKSNRPNEDGYPIENNSIIDLTYEGGYSLKLEVIPAWHNEIIAKHSAIGLKFHLHLFRQSKTPDCKIGITGDTYAYRGIEKYYKDCDILVAHLGDIKIKEIISSTNYKINSYEFIETFFSGGQYTTEKLRDFVNFLSRLDIIDIDKHLKQEEIVLLKKYANSENSITAEQNNDLKQLKIIVSRLVYRIFTGDNFNDNLYNIYEYKNHLGVLGLLKLHVQMCLNAISDGREEEKLLIIGEFPEELGSHKHSIARILNGLLYNQKQDKSVEYMKRNECSKKLVRCLTGDIGLHVGVFHGEAAGASEDENKILLKIRCLKCHQNTELIERNLHYHRIEHIQETILKKEDNRMVYLCSKYEHAMLPRCKPNTFMVNLHRNI